MKYIVVKDFSELSNICNSFIRFKSYEEVRDTIHNIRIELLKDNFSKWFVYSGSYLYFYISKVLKLKQNIYIMFGLISFGLEINYRVKIFIDFDSEKIELITEALPNHFYKTDRNKYDI